MWGGGAGVIDKGEGGHANASERRAAIVWPAWYWCSLGVILFGVHVGPVLTIVMIGTSFFFSEDLLDRVAYPITRCHIIIRGRE